MVSILKHLVGIFGTLLLINTGMHVTAWQLAYNYAKYILMNPIAYPKRDML